MRTVVNLLLFFATCWMRTKAYCFSTGMTPLSTASLHSHEEVVRVLLQHGASVNIADRHNNLPLHCAVRSGNTRLASAILAAGNLSELTYAASSVIGDKVG